jgi:hypothetical protein
MMEVILSILLEPCHILAVTLSYCPALQRTTPRLEKFSPGLAMAKYE